MSARALLLALLLGAAPSLAQEDPSSGREQLREALGDYYAHLLGERLELTESQATSLRPRIEALVAAQQHGLVGFRQGMRRLDGLLGEERPDPGRVAALLRHVLEAERAGHERMAAVRRELVEALEPRQRATYLLFEEDYREEVRGHLRSLRAGGGRSVDGGPELGPRQRPGPRQPPGPPGQEVHRPPEGLTEDLTLLLALQVRRRLGLDLEALVGLLPDLEAAVEAQVALSHLQQRGHRALRDSLDSQAEGGRLDQLTSRLLAEQGERRSRLLTARAAVVARLDPVAGARFLMLHERFSQQAPGRLLALERLHGGERPPNRPRFERGRPR